MEDIHGTVVSEQEAAIGLGFADVIEFRRWQTELGNKNSELEYALRRAKDEARGFQWHGRRMGLVLDKLEVFLKKIEIALADKLEHDLRGAWFELPKLILAIRVVSGREVDWEHVLDDWLDDEPLRNNLPPECLMKFGNDHLRNVTLNGQCHKCADGIVLCMRDEKTLKLRLDCIHCMRCGQRYFLEKEDYVKFFGYQPSEEQIA